VSKIHKSIDINAPIDRVYAFMTDPEHYLEIWPSMVEVKNAKRSSDGAHSFDWTYKMAGLSFHGHTDTLEAVKNDHVVVKSDQGIPSTFRWQFAKHDGHTEVTVDVDYTPPGKLLGKLAARFIDRLNEHEAETVLANLKDRMEIGDKH
jgi:uncharacterized membrane protein